MSIKQYACAKGVDFKYAKGKTDIYDNTFHLCFELFLLLEGNVILITDVGRVSLRPYQLAIIPPGKYHQFVVQNNLEAYERCVLNISPDLIDAQILKNALADKELLTLPHDSRVLYDFLYLKELLEQDRGSDLLYILPAIAINILFGLKNTESTVCVTSSQPCSLSQKIVTYINHHYTENLDLEQISQRLYISVSTLCHTFKSDFGITVKQYIMQKRMNAARLAIQNGEGAEDVCRKIGFHNYSAFFRAYKKQFGVNPSKNKRFH